MFETRTLSNGARLLTARQAEAQSTAVMVMYAAGSRYEREQEGGIAHFCEHMFFKGTERRPDARQIAFEVDSIGGEFNAFTSKEYTGYYIKCAAEHVPVALDVLSDMLLHSRFDGEEIEREKGVIVEEMNMYLDTPTDYLPGVYDKLCYGDTPLGRDIIGRKETVRAATRETFLDYMGRWYVRRACRGLGGAVSDAAVTRSRSCSAASRTARPAPTRAGRRTVRPARSRCTGRSPTSSTCASAAPACRSATPTATRRSCWPPCSAVGCPRGCSPRCASGAGWPTTSSPSTASTSTLGRSTPRPASTSSGPTRPSAPSSPSCGGWSASRYRRRSCTRPRASSRAGWCWVSRIPRSIVGFGLRGLVLEGRARELPEVLDGIESVTAEDIQRVANDLFGERLRLAAIGPFDDEDRFAALLAESA